MGSTVVINLFDICSCINSSISNGLSFGAPDIFYSRALLLIKISGGQRKIRGPVRFRVTKEGVLLRNVRPSLVLCDHFPGGGILEVQTGSSWEWPFIVCLFWE